MEVLWRSHDVEVVDLHPAPWLRKNGQLIWRTSSGFQINMTGPGPKLTNEVVENIHRICENRWKYGLCFSSCQLFWCHHGHLSMLHMFRASILVMGGGLPLTKRYRTMFRHIDRIQKSQLIGGVSPWLTPNHGLVGGIRHIWTIHMNTGWD